MKSNILIFLSALIVTLASGSDSAWAYASGCKINNENCAAGLEAARGRWIGEDAEHLEIWDRSLSYLGAPASLSEPLSLEVFVNGDTVGDQPSLKPALLDRVAISITRTMTIGEFAQLPDFSFSLWDWSQGNESCPLGDFETNACHTLDRHRGAVNSNHFLPQSFEHYVYYHRLALDQAATCKRALDSMPDNRADLRKYLLACEKTALVYEAIGHHFLQDSWSMGHMWERWGSPSKADMPDHFDSLAVGATAGIIHGARRGLQPHVDGYADINDAMCAPTHDEVRWVSDEVQEPVAGLGDSYFEQMVVDVEHSHSGKFYDQHSRLFACATAGITEVYRAAGQIHGELSPITAFDDVDPTNEADCFGQRATNAAMSKAAGYDILIGGMWPYHLRMDSWTSTLGVLAVAYSNSEERPSFWKMYRKQNHYRRDLSRIMTRLELYAKAEPHGTQMANGGLGSLMSIHPNGHYRGQGAPRTDYIDPPATGYTSAIQASEIATRRQVITHTFHEGMAQQLCGDVNRAVLETMRARSTTSPAAHDACIEFSARHIRRGWSPASYAKDVEPLCGYLDPSSTFIYLEGSLSEGPAELAERYCDGRH